MTLITKPPQQRVPETICLVGLILFPAIAAGQGAPAPARVTAQGSVVTAVTLPAAAEKASAPALGISYANGQLTINVSNSTLAAVLTRVAALTGASIDIPEGASGEQIPTLELGPGPARQIVTSLLSDSNFDYLIQGSDTDGEKIQSVLLMPRGTKDNIPDVPGRPGRGPFARAAAAPPPPEDVPAPEPAVAPPDQTAAAAANPAPAAQPDLSAPPVYGQPLQTNVPKTFPVAPPASMDQQSINQTLQQMYQQRMQMLQQEHQAASPATPANQ